MQLSAAATFSFPDLDALKAFLAAHEERQTAKIIPLPGLPISKDVELAQRRTTPFPALPVIAPEAFDFDFDQAWEHIGAIEPRAAEDPSFLMHFRAEDDKGGKSKELQRFTDVSLLDVKNDTSFSELVPWENKKGEIVYWQMNKPGYLTLQSKGAALHVLVNESCGNHRRRKKDIVAYRAIFCEHDNKDGKSLEELIASFPLRPSLIIESSPGKYHFLWLFKERWPVNPETDELWRALQQNFVDNYGGDENAMDPSRVLRLAGSLHLKGEHWRVPIVENNGERFSMADLVQAFKPVIRETKAQGAVASTIDDLIGARADFEKAREALQYIHPACDNLHAPGRPDQLLKPYKPWLDIGMALCARFGNEAYTLWDTWSAAAGSAVYPGSEATWTHWESFSEPGDDRHGRPLVTLATIFGYAKQHGWPNGPVPQWDLAPGGPQIAPVAGSRDGKPIHSTLDASARQRAGYG